MDTGATNFGFSAPDGGAVKIISKDEDTNTITVDGGGWQGTDDVDPTQDRSHVWSDGGAALTGGSGKTS